MRFDFKIFSLATLVVSLSLVVSSTADAQQQAPLENHGPTALSPLGGSEPTHANTLTPKSNSSSPTSNPTSSSRAALPQRSQALNQAAQVETLVQPRVGAATVTPAEPPLLTADPVTPQEPNPGSNWSLPLTGPKPAKKKRERAKGFDVSKLTEGPLVTTIGSLCVVLSLFFALTWLVKKSNPKNSQGLPQEALEVLGHAPLAGKQKMQLVRLGNKILLLAIGPDEVQTLGELTDPDEVMHVASLCQQNSSGSASDTFRQILRRMGQEPTANGFLGTSRGGEEPEEPAESEPSRRRRTLFEA